MLIRQVFFSDNSGKDYKYFQADSEADVLLELKRLQKDNPSLVRDDLIWVKKNNGGRLESTLTATQERHSVRACDEGVKNHDWL